MLKKYLLLALLLCATSTDSVLAMNKDNFPNLIVPAMIPAGTDLNNVYTGIQVANNLVVSVPILYTTNPELYIKNIITQYEYINTNISEIESRTRALKNAISQDELKSNHDDLIKTLSSNIGNLNFINNNISSILHLHQLDIINLNKQMSELELDLQGKITASKITEQSRNIRSQINAEYNKLIEIIEDKNKEKYSKEEYKRIFKDCKIWNEIEPILNKRTELFSKLNSQEGIDNSGSKELKQIEEDKIPAIEKQCIKILKDQLEREISIEQENCINEINQFTKNTESKISNMKTTIDSINNIISQLQEVSKNIGPTIETYQKIQSDASITYNNMKQLLEDNKTCAKPIIHIKEINVKQIRANKQMLRNNYIAELLASKKSHEPVKPLREILFNNEIIKPSYAADEMKYFVMMQRAIHKEVIDFRENRNKIKHSSKDNKYITNNEQLQKKFEMFGEALQDLYGKAGENEAVLQRLSMVFQQLSLILNNKASNTKEIYKNVKDNYEMYYLLNGLATNKTTEVSKDVSTNLLLSIIWELYGFKQSITNYLQSLNTDKVINSYEEYLDMLKQNIDENDINKTLLEKKINNLLETKPDNNTIDRVIRTIKDEHLLETFDLFMSLIIKLSKE